MSPRVESSTVVSFKISLKMLCLYSKLSTMVSAPVFISSIVRNQQTLHRVRLGPMSSQGEVQQTQDSVRMANLGQAKLVTD